MIVPSNEGLGNLPLEKKFAVLYNKLFLIHVGNQSCFSVYTCVGMPTRD